jgi:hypothetical protein
MVTHYPFVAVLSCVCRARNVTRVGQWEHDQNHHGLRETGFDVNSKAVSISFNHVSVKLHTFPYEQE